MRIGRAAGINDQDTGVALDTLDMGMAADNDIGPPAKGMLHCPLNRPVRIFVRIQYIVHQPQRVARTLFHNGLVQPWVFRDDRATTRAFVAIAPTRHHRRDFFEPVQHGKAVEIAGVDNQVGPGEHRAHLAGEFRHGLGDMRVGDESDFHTRKTVRERFLLVIYRLDIREATCQQ